MATFTYSARNVDGKIQSGELQLPSKDDVIAQLRRQRLMPVKVQEKKGGINLSFGTGIKTRDIVVVTRQFATMINSGLPLVQSLEILAQQTENKALAKVLEEVLYDIESGNTLADSLRKHPSVFSDLYVNMVAAGEAGGILDIILLRLATFLEKNDTLVRKIKGAMLYPAIIMAVAVGAVAVMLYFVIPTFQRMFESVGASLPAPTMFVIFLSQQIQDYWLYMLAGLVAAAFIVRQVYRTPAGQLHIDRAMLHMPILGDMLRKASVARFTRTLGTLVSSGVSILDGLEITARTAGNRVIHDAVMESRASIAGGETIAEPLKRSGVFPPMVVQMINVGEQTGGLDEMLAKIADFYDEEVDVAVEALLKAIEPVLIIVLGGVVGGMIIAMYLPIFSMVDAVQ